MNEEEEEANKKKIQNRFRKSYIEPQLNFNNSIQSYGLIVFAVDNSISNNMSYNNIKFLIYQRRDSFEYTEFIRGMYNTDEHIKTLFSLMTPDERTRVCNYSFDMLWKDLWVDEKCRIFKDGYLHAKNKFDNIKDKLQMYINTTRSQIRETPWGWCKGKKNRNETSLMCAIREFGEETRLSTNNLQIIDNELNVIEHNSNTNHYYIENYTGSNNKNYSSHYYLARYTSIELPSYIHTPELIRKSMISDEVNDLRWITFDESYSYLNPRRVNLLKIIINKLKYYNFSNNDKIK